MSTDWNEQRVFRWNGPRTADEVRSALLRGDSVRLELALGLHHTITSRLAEGDSPITDPFFERSGGPELIEALAELDIIQGLWRLVAKLPERVRVRIVSPSPIVFIDNVNAA